MKALIWIAFLASPAWAADDLPFSPAATEACLLEAVTPGARKDCIGRSAEVCYTAEGVYSNYAVGVCLGAEADYWDTRLNSAYSALLAAEVETLAELRAGGATVPDTATALREMQRAWIPFRDAACWYEYTTWAGGTGGGPASARCLMEVTGQQALALETRVKERSE